MTKNLFIILLTVILSLFIITLYFLAQSDANQAHAVEDNTSNRDSHLTKNSQNTSNNSTEKTVSVSIPLKKPPFIKDE